MWSQIKTLLTKIQPPHVFFSRHFVLLEMIESKCTAQLLRRSDKETDGSWRCQDRSSKSGGRQTFRIDVQHTYKHSTICTPYIGTEIVIAARIDRKRHTYDISDWYAIGFVGITQFGLSRSTVIRLYSTPYKYVPDSRSSSGHTSGTTMYGIYTSVRCMANAWTVSAHGIMPPEA